MSNYTKATNFASKDTLVTGDPLKTLSGTEIDDEFNYIAVAIATKANSSNTVLTGTPTAPTAGTSANSTQLATTAFVQAQKASPTFSGTPSGPTAPIGTLTTQLATCAYVANATPSMGINSVIIDGATGVQGKNIYIDNDAPVSEGNNGDVWFEY